MNLTLITLFIIIIALAFSITSIIYKKKSTIMSLLIEILVLLVLLIRWVDISYYNDLSYGVEYFDYYIAAISVFALILSVNEIVLFKKKNKKIKEQLLLDYKKSDDKLQYLNLLSYDVAYYDKNKDSFILNKAFVNDIESSKNELTNDELLVLMVDSDKEIYNSNNDVARFRLKIKNGITWFEIKKDNSTSDEIVLIYKYEEK